MAASLAGRAAGTVTEAFADSADRRERTGCYPTGAGFVEQCLAGVCQATALECTDHQREVYVGVDGSSHGHDWTPEQDVGGVGAWKDYGRGLQEYGHCTGAR